jgi:hypothetical protein
MTTDIKGASERGAKGKSRIEQLSEAAEMVQGFAYDLATHLDATTTTELMLISRRLERLAESLSKEKRIVEALARLDNSEIPTEG